ncbi:hypothetical protein [Brumimicrobium oceani]|uniref:Lipoprotein n=1 Tax=Brumimicrobium oceani TaxID=2100725 RepID=A0A2U2XG93_9FLAO|nr:hypothetical protein [Brumimicrobium oceani]PWH86829.1 hypothetical protein DIT68_00780 [Brumimicrobium oceani]
MFWTKFKLKNSIYLCSIFFIASACSGDDLTENNVVKQVETAKETLSEEEKIIRQVENILDINAAENYDIQIQYKHIDPDTLKDALILVNRKEFGHQKAKNTNTERFFESTGHTGLYNFVFLKLGGSDKLITTAPVGSNADYPLTVEFLELTSKAHKDFIVEYRVRNSLHRNYYTVRKDKMFLTFSCPVFDSIGAPKPVAYDIVHTDSEVRIAKDIALYDGRIKDYNPDEIENINFYTPKEIIRDGGLYVFFIFDDKKMKYVTPM